MKKRDYRILGLTLSVMLCLTACGSKTETVTDYGGISAGGTEVNGSSEDTGQNKGGSGTGSERREGTDEPSSIGTGEEGGGTETGTSTTFGKLPPEEGVDGAPIYEDTFTLGTHPVDVRIMYTRHDTDRLHVYRVSRIKEDMVREEEVVKNLFGDTAVPVKGTIGGTEEEEDDCVVQCRRFSNGDQSDVKGGLVTKQKIGPVPAWGDEEDRFWHTYDGEMDGIPYRLFIAYRKAEMVKYISFWPKNPGDLTGDPEMTSLMSYAGNIYFDEGYDESYKQMLRQPNQSVKSDEEICSMAEKFTEEKLHARMPREDLFISTTQFYDMEGESDEEQKVQLLFSTPLYGENMITPPRGVVDGYEVQCNWTHSSSLAIFSSDDTGNNTGHLYVTDRGVVGGNLVISYELQEELSENVEILPFDKVIAALKVQVQENFDESKINGTRLGFDSAVLSFQPVESPDKPGEATFVPTWGFFAGSNGGVGVVYLNAMDGSLIHIEYVR